MNRLLFVIFIVAFVSLNSCKPNVEGCLDPKADNYDPYATLDGKNCIYDGVIPGGDTTETPQPIAGCTDSTASNYNPDATIDDGSCLFPGCTDPEADNYDPKANVDDGSCIDKREKFAGDWQVTNDCPMFLPISDPQTISFDTTEVDSILFSPFSAFGDTKGSVDGFDVTIPQRNISFGGFATISFGGSGTMNTNKDQIIINLNYDGGFFGSGTCVLTYDKL